jgi:hypothetical protein
MSFVLYSDLQTLEHLDSLKRINNDMYARCITFYRNSRSVHSTNLVCEIEWLML